MTSQQETPVATDTVILASPNNRDEWIEVIKRKATPNQIWKYVNPSTPAGELPKLEEPIRASPKDINQQSSQEPNGSFAVHHVGAYNTLIHA